MFDRYLCKSYKKYINKKIKLVYDTKYNSNVEIIGYLKESPYVMGCSNIYTLPSFTVLGHPYTMDTNYNSRLITVPLLMVKYIYLIEEDYNTKKNLLLLKENNIIIPEIYDLIYLFIDGNEYKEIEI